MLLSTAVGAGNKTYFRLARNETNIRGLVQRLKSQLQALCDLFQSPCRNPLIFAATFRRQCKIANKQGCRTANEIYRRHRIENFQQQVVRTKISTEISETFILPVKCCFGIYGGIKMFLIFLLILLFAIICAKEGGGEVSNTTKMISVRQKKYLEAIVDGKLILRDTPPAAPEDFPWVKYYLSIDDAIRIYSEISHFKLERNGNVLTQTSKNYYFQVLIDYFQEYCRMMCRRVNTKMNALEAWKQIAAKLAHASAADKYLEFKKTYQPCSEFNPVWLTNLFPLFEEKCGPIRSMLDMSAGRGARMIACAAAGVNYTGVDPCECTHENYSLMKSFAQYCGAKSKIEFIRSGFEEPWEAKLPLENFQEGPFDLMFSSPPYFDLEIYEDTPGQSISKFSQLEDWLHKFLRPCMEKSLKLLRPRGIMALNIDNPIHMDTDYVGPMLGFKFPNAEYIGNYTIRCGGVFNIWCWQKKII